MKNKDNTSTVLYVPLNQTGTYTVLAHSTLFAGDSTTEPITLTAKFTNMTSYEIVNSENSSELKPIINDTGEDEMISESNDKTLIISNNASMIISETKSNSEFDLGLVIGITLGAAIGISVIFIIRQKSD